MKRRANKLKIYLDTSVITALFDKRNPEIMYWTNQLWEHKDEFNCYISNVVVAEIQETIDVHLRKAMLEAIQRISILEIDEEAEQPSNEYIYQGVVPKKYKKDALHIAIATVNDMDILMSWNYEHIVKRKTKEIVRMANILSGYHFIEIISPPEALEG